MAVISNGTTLIDNGILDAAIPTGKMTLIKTLTASSSATLSFVDGTSDVVLDDTYDEYVFKFINMHPQNDAVEFHFNISTDGGSNYNVTKTTSFFWTYHYEDDSEAVLSYQTGRDLAQSTAFQTLTSQVGNGADECVTGLLHLFNPSSTTFVKHFIGTTNSYGNGNASINGFSSGYANTTSAVNAVQFKMASGNIDDGVIKLYGIGG